MVGCSGARKKGVPLRRLRQWQRASNNGWPSWQLLAGVGRIPPTRRPSRCKVDTHRKHVYSGDDGSLVLLSRCGAACGSIAIASSWWRRPLGLAACPRCRCRSCRLLSYGVACVGSPVVAVGDWLGVGRRSAQGVRCVLSVSLAPRADPCCLMFDYCSWSVRLNCGRGRLVSVVTISSCLKMMCCNAGRALHLMW